jgi:hypothetical protein
MTLLAKVHTLKNNKGKRGEEKNCLGLEFPIGFASLVWSRVSYPVLRPNRVLIVWVHMNQIYTHAIQKIDTE